MPVTNAPPIWRWSAAPPLFSAVLALLIRGAVLASLWGTPLTRVMVGDSRTYREIARLLIEGRLSEVGVFFQTPLYPFFLAVLERMFGPGWAAVALVQALLGSLASVDQIARGFGKGARTT